MATVLAPLLLAALALAAAQPPPEVQLPGQGALRGATVGTFGGRRRMHRFLGVPYAAAAPLRFQEAGEPLPWAGVRAATEPAPACPQLPLARVLALAGPALSAPPPVPAAAGRDPEDCLTLDIYTPTLNQSARLPVLLFIHGGYFVSGHSGMASGGFLLERADLVLVSAQYRLGPGGFLPLRRPGAPGSAGLRDLLRALRWVREHARVFGGDPERVVAGGVSAGAALAGLLHASPAGRPLLAGAALFSGGALSPWALDGGPERSCRGVAALAGCLRAGPLLGCLRARSPAALALAWAAWTAYEKLHGRHGMGGVTPALDPAAGHEPLLPRRPRLELADSGRGPGPPLLVAVTKHEGTFLHRQLDMLYVRPRNLTGDPRALDRQLGQLLLSFADAEDPLHVLGDAVRRLYFAPEALGNYSALYEGLVDFTGAAFFKGPAQLAAQLAEAAGAPAYLLTFAHEPDNAVGGVFEPGAVHHGVDQLFLFPQPGLNYSYSDRDLRVAEAYSGLLSSFVTQLRPELRGLPWRPYQEQWDEYAVIGPEPALRSGFSEEFFVMRRERQESSESTPVSPTDSTTARPGGGAAAAPSRSLTAAAAGTAAALLLGRMVRP